MVASNHQFISLLSCSCIVLAIVPVTPYSVSTLLPFRTTLPRKQCNHSLKLPQPSYCYNPTRTVLYSTNPTGKKRRRRKDTTGDDTGSAESSESTTSMSDTFNEAGSMVQGTSSTNELPDFDIMDDVVTPASTAATNSKNTGSKTSSSASKPTTVDPLIGTITPNMMASAPATNRAVANTILSVNELRDRSLEQKLESLYDGDPTLAEQVKEELPDLLTLQKERKKVTTEQILLSASSMSKKERQTMARQQQDMEQQTKKALVNAEEDEDNIFSKLPFITNESGKIEPLKLLEAATWTCIIALVLWEVYINSPLFSRAAPIIPIVYDLWI